MLRRLLQELRLLAREDDAAETMSGGGVRRFFRFWVAVGRGFVRNRCPVRASALAYSSLLAFIPLFAVVMGVATGVLKGERKKIEGYLNLALANLAPQFKESPEFVEMQGKIVKYTFDGIDTVNSGALGTTGMVALLVLIIFMLARIEETLNDIWGIAKGRSWYSRVVNYWAAISLGPVVLVAAISTTAALKLPSVRGVLDEMPSVGSLLINLTPVPVVGAAFALFYALVPNTKVQWRAALVGGMTSALLWHGVNQASFLFVSQVTRNSKIYGTLVPIPVFMAGLYFSWLLLLFGSQVAYAYQNRRSQMLQRLSEKVDQRGRELVALRVMLEVGRAYGTGTEVPTVGGLADRMRVPGALVQKIVGELLRARLLLESAGSEPGVVPGRPLEQILVADVLSAMRRGGVDSAQAGPGEMGRITEREAALVAEAERKAGARSVAELIAGVEVAAVAAAPTGALPA